MSFAVGFDIGAALLLTALGARGFFRGFVGEVLSLVGLGCGIFFAWQFAHEGTELVMKYFPALDHTIANLIAMSAIFFCIAVVAAIISKILLAVVKFAALSSFNHVAGCVLGVATGVAVLLFIYGAIIMLAPALGDKWINDSIFMQIISKIWPSVYGFMTARGWVDPAKLVP